MTQKRKQKNTKWTSDLSKILMVNNLRRAKCSGINESSIIQAKTNQKTNEKKKWEDWNTHKTHIKRMKKKKQQKRNKSNDRSDVLRATNSNSKPTQVYLINITLCVMHECFWGRN